MRYFEFRAMNTHILLAAEGPEEQVQAGFLQAQAFIQAGERRFTRFSEDSELSQLNRSAGAWFSASPDLFEVVSQAVRLHHLTGGLFDPAVLDALEQVGYDRSMEEIRVYGAAIAPVLFRTRPRSIREVLLDGQRAQIFLPEGLRLDLGGIAKGWITERAAHILSECSTACAVDAGGDAFAIGLPAGESAWQMTLEDPSDETKALAVLNLPPGAAATSAVTKRRWLQGGVARHHLIDPRSQLPAETDWLSVTAIASHLAEAEVFAKSLLIGGSRQSAQIARAGDALEFIAVDQQSHLWGSDHSREYIHV
jgi:thiamine biosynthesis lipoprotein